MMEREWGYVNNNEVIEKDNQYTELEGKKKKKKMEGSQLNTK